MNIESPCVVTLTWTLKDTLNHVIDERTEPTEYFYGGDDLLPKVEEALREHAAGDQLDLHLEPENAFGNYDEQLVFFAERAKLPAPIEPGMQFEGLPESAVPDAPRDQIYTVTEVYEQHVVLDGNHPLAGMALRLSLKVIGVRAANEAEIERKSVTPNMFEIPDQLPLGRTRH